MRYIKTAREGGVSAARILAVDACKNTINFIALCAFSDTGWQDCIEILDVLTAVSENLEKIQIFWRVFNF
jgi:hypothetical protein